LTNLLTYLDAGYPENFLDQGGAQGLRGFPETCPGRHARRADRCRRKRKVGEAKPFHGVEGGVFEIASRFRGDAFRALYAVKIDADIWVIHAFQKKSKSGIKTPRMEVELVHDRLKRLKEALK
jgi:phage-related protein